MRKSTVVILISLWLNAWCVYASAYSLSIFVDGKMVFFPDQLPYVEDGRTMVPVRFITERLGAKVEWDEPKKAVIITHKTTQITLTMGHRAALRTFDGHEQIVVLDAPATLKNGRVMVPLRFVSEAMGSEVQWDASTSAVHIFSPIKHQPDRKLLAHYQHLDENLHARVSTRESYEDLFQWSAMSLISTGEYSRFRESIDMRDSGQYLYYRYGIAGGKDIRWASLYFSEDDSFTNYFYYDLTTDVLLGQEEVIINKSDCRVGEGNPDWNKVRLFQIAFQAKDGGDVQISPSLLASYNGAALCTLSFDDGWRDNYTNAFRIISRIFPTMRAQIGIVPSLVNLPSYLTDEQIRELAAEGWEMNNHSFSHEALTDIPVAAVRMELLRAYDYLYEISPRGAIHLAVPYSEIDLPQLDIIRANTLSARHVPGQLNHIPFNRYAIAFMEVRNTTSFEEVKGWIDSAISEQKWLNLLFHRIGDPSDDRYTCSTVVFEEIIKYLHEKRDSLRVVTTSEALEEAGFIGGPQS